jgi:hypothetical protein
VVLGGLAWGGSLLKGSRVLTEWFFFEQDAPATVAIVAILAAASLVPAAWAQRAAPSFAARWAVVAAVGAAALAAVGWFFVMGDYPLSTDEFMARFDAVIFGQGRLYATIPAEWRPIRYVLQPQFNLFVPDGASWVSTYLPVNAMALAVFARLGSPAISGAVWLLVTSASVWGIARRLWPERRDAAAVAVVLLATGAQAVLTAMTPYAMSAHMALNMLWLWLFLRDDRPSQAAAVLVAFAACGLHQVVFHPLFAAPFVAQLWLGRRWGRAVFHTLAYAVIGLFWISYWRLFLPEGAGGAAAGGGEDGLAIWIARFELVTKNFTVASLGLMAMNLFRFLTWQNPAAIVLALCGLWPALRRPGAPRALVGGAALTVVAVTVMMPFQGHGWGYRYLHGFLGSLALMGALGWIGLTGTAERRRTLGAGVALLSLLSVAVLVPLRGWQANRFIRPYAEAEAAIVRTDAEVVVVDTTGLAFAADLVRNDPFLRNRPKMVDLAVARPRDAAAICARGRVVVFDRASRSGIRPFVFNRASLARMAAARGAMEARGCATERIVMR